MLVESVADEGGCPACGVISGLIKDRPTSRVKTLPHGPVPMVVWVRKRRFACVEGAVRAAVLHRDQRAAAGPRAGHDPVDVKVCAAVTTTNRAVIEVATDYGIAWWIVHRILVKAAAEFLGQAAPIRRTTVVHTW